MLRNFAITLLLACAGSALGYLSGLPLGQLLGAAALVLIACRMGLALATPPAAIVVIQLILGASVGALLNAEMLQGMADLTILAGLLICMSAQLAVGFTWLYRVEKWTRTESLLGAVPGAMAAVMTLTGEEGKTSAKMVFAHMVRMIALLVAVFLIAGPQEETLEIAAVPDGPDNTAIWAGYVSFLLLAAGAYIAGRVLERFAMPAPYMVTGLMLAAGVNLWLGGDPIVVPEPLVLFAMALLGGLIGIRLKDITRHDIASYLRAGLIVTSITFGITIAMAFGFSLLTGQPFLVLFMSWVPGGVEVMVATALALGLEPAFVMLNHVLRMSVLHIAPMFMSRDFFRPDPQGIEKTTDERGRHV
ncbi:MULTISPECIES: AbrB family transcriptional regulator [Phaeobacter]|uniref:Membrane protein AbrB duplication n=1 Tax=Phaeobacter piscinae TaxID=1580596 RepID=A0ABM7DMZ4_9RHOB|nr:MULTISPECIES: AbrB family transcriptional regulator [Phaeobacter]ATG37943.1 membrane protein AbrB duplication [Phaeobacter piscinae]ATG41867.1 membrane protein AbrB duplication [Phaeobacter piscinae]AUQ88464.1 membrane protein AbrB duplication [Phaeobacter piscinae]AUR26347.1 membrane protein AbrB duplication [Phaeobacter piscinae]